MYHQCHHKCSERRSRRGTVYIAVLGVTLLVGIMASVAVTITRLDLRGNRNASAKAEASILARTGAEYGISFVSNASWWRTSFQSGVDAWTTNWGNGTYAWRLTDADGSLTDDERDNITVSGIGQVDGATIVESATLIPTGTPISCLEVALLSNQSVTLPNGIIVVETQIRSNQTVASNANIDATNSVVAIHASVEAVGTASGDITGSATSGVSTRVLPNHDAFDFYKLAGTWIEIWDIGLNGADREMNGVVLSPASNPYGFTNPEGIYVIDCQGQKLVVKHSRIVGTLVVLNPGAGSGIIGSSLFERAVPNYPVLMVDGDFSLSVSEMAIQTLSESAYSVNLNPPGTPYQGSENTTETEVYTAKLDGVVYVSGAANVPGYTTVCGGLYSDALNVSSGVQLRSDYDATYHNYPPPGFAIGDPMVVIPGSWRRETN